MAEDVDERLIEMIKKKISKGKRWDEKKLEKILRPETH